MQRRRLAVGGTADGATVAVWEGSNYQCRCYECVIVGFRAIGPGIASLRGSITLEVDGG